jgi:hypothetical protein
LIHGLDEFQDPLNEHLLIEFLKVSIGNQKGAIESLDRHSSENEQSLSSSLEKSTDLGNHQFVQWFWLLEHE